MEVLAAKRNKTQACAAQCDDIAITQIVRAGTRYTVDAKLRIGAGFDKKAVTCLVIGQRCMRGGLDACVAEVELHRLVRTAANPGRALFKSCLLYTSDAADDPTLV